MNDVTDPVSGEREKVRFSSGGSECAAWHYPGSDGACVIMAGGFAVTKEPGTDLFARRFHDAGFGVLAFDYRGFGESGGRAAPSRLGRRTVDGLASRCRVRSDPAGSRPEQAGALGVLRIRRSPPPGSGAHPAPRRRDRPDAERRGSGRRTPRGAPPETTRPAAPARQGRPRRGRMASSAVRPCWCHSAASPAPSPSSPHRTRPTPHARSIPTTGIRTGGRRSRPARRSASGSTVPAVTPPAYGVRCSSSYASRTSPPRPRRPCARRGGRPARSWCGCPAGTTRRSWTRTNGRSTPSCRSCADMCSIPRWAPSPPWSADDDGGDRAVGGDGRVPGHGWRRSGAGAAAWADDGRLAVGRDDQRARRRPPVRGTDPAARGASARHAGRRRPVAARGGPAGRGVPRPPRSAGRRPGRQ